MPWSHMVDMELDDEDKLDACTPIPCAAPKYPYGLCLSLTHRELEKLGLSPDCEVGDVIDLRAFAEVTSVSVNQSSDGSTNCRVELQIQKLAVENEMTEGYDED